MSRLRLVQPGEQRPHVDAVNAVVAAFLHLRGDQAVAALSECLEMAGPGVIVAALRITAPSVCHTVAMGAAIAAELRS